MDDLEGHFSNERQLRRLVHTLTPEQSDYLRKVDIIIKEGWDENVAPWLARDAQFLLGRIDEPKAEGV